MNKNFDKFLIDIISAGLVNDVHKIELASLSLSRLLKKENPEISKQISDLISEYASGGNLLRSKSQEPLPINDDSQLEMANIFPPNIEINDRPILSELFNRKVDSFLDEREKTSVLLEQGIRPSNSLLLIGPSGTGKTMLAKFIASALKKNLVVLDLSSSISSLLGKTGSNLKKVLDYAKKTSSVLLLDEFDAIAKRRDDSTDLGEIKRVVNVLLMELENWPISSVLIATSNHPELLDKAIWRRFDHLLEVELPEENGIVSILKKELGSFFPLKIDADTVLEMLTDFLKGKSAADICKYSNNVKRRIILKKEDFILASLTELIPYQVDKKSRGRLCSIAKDKLGDLITLRELSNITGLSIPGVQHHVTKQNAHE